MIKAAPGNFTGAGRAGDSMRNNSLWRLTRRRARCPGRKSANHLSAVFIALTSLALNLAAVNVGLVDAGGAGSDLDLLAATIQGLGHQSEKLPESDLPRPTGLLHYNCIILAHRSGPLTAAGYQALAGYVNDGGTLLLTGLAGYWMKTPGGDRDRAQIRGAGPLKDVAGVRITAPHEMPIRQLIVREKSPAVMGLPESFALKTTPPYDINNPAAWKHCGAFGLQAESAASLIMLQTINAEGKPAESVFLTVNQHGAGQCYRLALCRIAPLVLEKKEHNITLILQNILRDSAGHQPFALKATPE